MNKTELINQIIKNGAWINGTNIMQIYKQYNNDREVAEAAINRSAKSVEYLSDDLKNDVPLMRTAVSKSFIAYQHMGPDAKKDVEIIKAMLQKKSSQIFKERKKIPKDIFSDRDLMLNSLRSSNNVKHFDKSLKEDPEFAKKAIEINYKSYQNFPDSIKDNAEVLIHGLTKTYHRDEFFQHASDRLKELCKDKDPIKTLESFILHEQLQKEIKPKALDFAKNLSAECKQATMEQSKPRVKMKI